MNTGTKTSSPVVYETAKGIYDKLVREKTAKGYTPGEDGTPYHNTAKSERVTGILPQLLNPIEEEEVHRLIKDPAWCMQEKKDGKRTLLQKQGAAIHGINKKGLLVGLPSPIVVQFNKFPAMPSLMGRWSAMSTTPLTCCKPAAIHWSPGPTRNALPCSPNS